MTGLEGDAVLEGDAARAELRFAPGALSKAADRTLTGLVLVLDAILGVAIVAITLLVLWNIASRNILGKSVIWLPEVAEIALGVITFIGGAAAYARGAHPAMIAIVQKLPMRWRTVHALVADWTIVGAGFALVWSAIPLISLEWSQPSPILQFSMGWGLVIVAVGASLIMLVGLLRLLSRDLRLTVATGGCLGALATPLYLSRQAWLPALGSHLLLAILLSLGLLILCGLPIAFALSLSAVVGIVGEGGLPFNTLAGEMQQGVTLNPILLAIPFFIFAGFVMEKGGLARRLMTFLSDLLVRIPGGIKHVLVVGMMIVSGMSGSKAADMTAVGTAMRETVEREGVSAEEMVAVLSASAMMGETIPPSIAMLVLGSITSLSVGALFVAGLLPAVFLAVCLLVLIAVRATREPRRPARAHATARDVLLSTARAIVPGCMPLLLVVGIVGGFATPEEVAAVAVLYGVVAGTLYRDLSIQGFAETVRDTASMSGMVMFITSAAAGFSWLLTTQDLQVSITHALIGIPGGKISFLIVTAGMLIVMGMLFEGLPALFVFTPLLLPAAMDVGVNGLQFGIVIVIAMGIGAFAPPMGIGFYVACGIGGTEASRVMPRTVPYLAVLILGLVVIALVPQITLWLPHLAGLE